jgi:nucleotidyltransferase/DNA polymerase involved in DNA repair
MPVGYEIRKKGLRTKAKITHVETKKAKEICKNAKAPEQSLIAVTADVNGMDTRVGLIPEPLSKYVSPRSKMAAFITRYKKPREVGMSIDVETNERGFWVMVL